MELIRGLHNLRPHHRDCVATIGAFDGVHKGHQAVLRRLIDKGHDMGLPTVVVVFEPLPREFFAPRKAPARLMSFREKFKALKALGIDRVLRIRFTETLRKMDADEFVDKVFVGGLGAKHIIIGDDLRFGRDRGGNFELLKKIGLAQGFDVEATETLTVGEERASSTRIRAALETTDFNLANELLGRPFSISGKVMFGKQLGRQLDAPTANLELHRLRSPLSGVFAVDAIMGEQTLHGVANVGTRPTVGEGLKAILEVHLLGFSGDIYGKHMEVVFRKKIRDEKKFDSIDDLKQQIHNDFETGRQYFASAN